MRNSIYNDDPENPQKGGVGVAFGPPGIQIAAFFLVIGVVPTSPAILPLVNNEAI